MINHDIFHVIKDPVHGTMEFRTLEDNWLKPFIDSPNFQRLRHIKQLGMGDFIFPGAVHTRFNHCLGCCYVSRQITNQIGLPEEESQLVEIACLLHDIGHGPFSHTFEDIFHHKLIRHEAWTPFFLADYRQPEFFDKYNKLNPRHPLNEEKFLEIENMIMHRTPQKRVLADIVSSQLDSDRLDYLLRDSHFCGVTYGEFDFRWMVNCMAIVNSDQGPRLGITHKGIGVVEHYLMARRLMMRNIYHLQKKLALEFFLVKLLQNLAEALATYAPFAKLRTSKLGQFLLAVNDFNHKTQAMEKVENHSQDFLQANYPIYKELCDYDIFIVIKQLAAMDDKHPAVLLAKRLQFRRMPKVVHLDDKDITQPEQLLAEFKAQNKNDFQDWQIALIETPHQSYTLEDPILVNCKNGTTRPINEMSLMIDAMSNKFENTAFLSVDAEIYGDQRVKDFLAKLTARVPLLPV
jgi:uncharacterized protein